MTTIQFVDKDCILLGEVQSSPQTNKALMGILAHMVRNLDAATALAYALRSCEGIEIRTALDKYNEAVK